MKIGVHIYLEKELHKDGKKRAIDVDNGNFSEYISKLIRDDLGEAQKVGANDKRNEL